MLWFLGVLCALALVALFFPFIFWIDFSAGLDGVTVHLRFFKKNIYTYKKKFGKDVSSEKEEAPEEKTSEEVAKAPVAVEKAEAPKQESTEPEKTPETEQAAPKVETEEVPAPEMKSGEDSAKDSEEKPETTAKAEPEVSEKKTEPEVSEKKDEPDASVKKNAEKESASKKTGTAEPSDDRDEEKRSLTDQEFWTLLLTPEFDERAWWAVRHELSALFKLFRIRFVDCFVEGFRMEYQNMGYAAALNGFLKSYPYIGDWDFRMDWTYDHDPYAEGHLRASVNLCRLLGLSCATLFFGGIVAWTFWRRRAHILKTGELPELGFIRKKIVKMMSEDD